VQKKILLIPLVLLLAISLTAIGCPEPEAPIQPAPEIAEPIPAPEPVKPPDQEVVQEPAQEPVADPQEITLLLITAAVTRVVDGDTIDVSTDGQSERVRLIGVDAPETVRPGAPAESFGLEASAFAKSKLGNRQVWLEMDVQERCRFGRLLAYVWLEQPASGNKAEARTLMFNAILLLEGYAQLATFPPNIKYVDMFTEFQREAREGNRGLWEAPSEAQPVPDVAQPAKVNINTATVEELQQIVHIGPARAEEIVRLRPFKSLDDLGRVRGLGPSRVADIKAEGVAYVE